MGNVAVKYLLRGAKQLLSRDRYTRNFEKSGSYTTAVNDFWAIKPRDVSTFNTGKVFMHEQLKSFSAVNISFVKTLFLCFC